MQRSSARSPFPPSTASAFVLTIGERRRADATVLGVDAMAARGSRPTRMPSCCSAPT
ncbi:MAG: hypothetical protein MZV64_44270 [Ignavibacteriales bacterium]|nr:hypothetical protein [Ignavibacteriales bacterium]